MCFDVSIPIRLICSTDGSLCLRSATTSFWHARCRRGPSTPTDGLGRQGRRPRKCWQTYRFLFSPVGGDGHLARLTLVRLEAQPVTDDAFPSRDVSLHQSAPVVSRRSLPAQAT